MSVSIEAKTRILRKRVEALALAPSVMVEAERVVRAAGMKLPNAAESLRVEWLNDMVASPGPRFGLAASDPGRHFIEWVRERARSRYHVTYRSVDVVASRIGAERASHFCLVVWPQEIAWAQRMRLDHNPNVATKAALFLREAEGQPGKMFERLADVYANAFLKAEYAASGAHELSPVEIRYADILPEFTPLFLRYAARAYTDKLTGMPRAKLEAFADLAARDETDDRNLDAGRQSALIARASPMCRMIPVIAEAISLKLGSNQTYLLEDVFVGQMEQGKIDIEPGTTSPHGAFIRVISDPVRRNAMLMAAPGRAMADSAHNLVWEVVNLPKSWLRGLPESYRRIHPNLSPAMETWQIEIAEERREAPIDPVCDFGFFLSEGGAR